MNTDTHICVVREDELPTSFLEDEEEEDIGTVEEFGGGIMEQ